MQRFAVRSRKTRAAISEFEKQSGIRIERWSAGKIGSHVKAARAIADLRGWPWNDAERQLERLVAGLRTAREQFEASIRNRDGVAPANGARS